jgi:hypothetical protein
MICIDRRRVVYWLLRHATVSPIISLIISPMGLFKTLSEFPEDQAKTPFFKKRSNFSGISDCLTNELFSMQEEIPCFQSSENKKVVVNIQQISSSSILSSEILNEDSTSVEFIPGPELQKLRYEERFLEGLLEEEAGFFDIFYGSEVFSRKSEVGDFSRDTSSK